MPIHNNKTRNNFGRDHKPKRRNLERGNYDLLKKIRKRKLAIKEYSNIKWIKYPTSLEK